MENFYCEMTKDTPEINFNAEKGELFITGASYPENSIAFFEPVIDLINDYFKQYDKKLILNVKLSYFNTSSSKALLDIFDILDEKYNEGRDIEVNWHYRDDYETILENGEEFAEDLSFPFNLIEYGKEDSIKFRDRDEEEK